MKQTSANDTQIIDSCDCPACRQHPDGAVAREHQAINRLLAVTDEQSRRLILGFLAQKEGVTVHGVLALIRCDVE
jgi:hypothetical protein